MSHHNVLIKEPIFGQSLGFVMGWITNKARALSRGSIIWLVIGSLMKLVMQWLQSFMRKISSKVTPCIQSGRESPVLFWISLTSGRRFSTPGQNSHFLFVKEQKTIPIGDICTNSPVLQSTTQRRRKTGLNWFFSTSSSSRWSSGMKLEN